MKIILLFLAILCSVTQAATYHYSYDYSANFAASPAPTFYPNDYVKTGYLTGSDQAIYYSYLTATMKNGTYVTFSPDGYVASGTLSGNQYLLLDWWGFLNIQFKGNTQVSFGSERVAGGTLLNDETLSYGLGVETITLKAGTVASFDYDYAVVTAGTISSTAQFVPYRNNDGIYTKARLMGNTAVSFNSSRLLYQGSISYDVAVEYGPSLSAYLSGPATFNQPWNPGYVSYGTTWGSSSQSLFAKNPSGWISVPASTTKYFMDGAVYRAAED